MNKSALECSCIVALAFTMATILCAWTWMLAFSRQDVVLVADNIHANSSIHSNIFEQGLQKRLKHASSEECKKTIVKEYEHYLQAVASEESQFFEHFQFVSQCPTASTKQLLFPNIHFQVTTENVVVSNQSFIKSSLHKRALTKDRDIVFASQINILYVMLVHSSKATTNQTHHAILRIFQALNETNHNFVVHVDKDSDSNDLFLCLLRSLSVRPNVHLLKNDNRISVNWGGFSVVNATLLAMKFAINQDLNFDYVINLSGDAYPLKSNQYIQQQLFLHHPLTFFMTIDSNRFQPHPELWNYFVECDNALHRISRLGLPRGIHSFVGSQWFALPKVFVVWLLSNPLPFQFAQYSKNTVVADETFFATMFMNSPFCQEPLLENLLFFQFGNWIHEDEIRDVSKCLAPNPQLCGRSPMQLTNAFKNAIFHSLALFARKFAFDDESSQSILHDIDEQRKNEASQNCAMVACVELVLRNTTANCLKVGSSEGLFSLSACNTSTNGQPLHLVTCHPQLKLLDYSAQGSDSLNLLLVMNESSQLCLECDLSSGLSRGVLNWRSCSGKWNQLFTMRNTGEISMWNGKADLCIFASITDGNCFVANCEMEHIGKVGWKRVKTEQTCLVTP